MSANITDKVQQYGESRGHVPWTEREIEYALRDDLRVHDIALAIGRSYTAVTSKRTQVRAARAGAS